PERMAESGLDLVEDRHDVPGVTQLAKPFEEAGRRRYTAVAVHIRFGKDRGEFVALGREDAFDRTDVVPVAYRDLGQRARQQARGMRPAFVMLLAGAGADADREMIVPAVVGAVKLEDPRAAGGGPGHMGGMQGRVRARSTEGHFFGAGHQLADPLRQLDFAEL